MNIKQSFPWRAVVLSAALTAAGSIYTVRFQYQDRLVLGFSPARRFFGFDLVVNPRAGFNLLWPAHRSKITISNYTALLQSAFPGGLMASIGRPLPMCIMIRLETPTIRFTRCGHPSLTSSPIRSLAAEESIFNKAPPPEKSPELAMTR